MEGAHCAAISDYWIRRRKNLAEDSKIIPTEYLVPRIEKKVARTNRKRLSQLILKLLAPSPSLFLVTLIHPLSHWHLSLLFVSSPMFKIQITVTFSPDLRTRTGRTVEKYSILDKKKINMAVKTFLWCI